MDVIEINSKIEYRHWNGKIKTGLIAKKIENGEIWVNLNSDTKLDNLTEMGRENGKYEIRKAKQRDLSKVNNLFEKNDKCEINPYFAYESGWIFGKIKHIDGFQAEVEFVLNNKKQRLWVEMDDESQIKKHKLQSAKQQHESASDKLPLQNPKVDKDLKQMEVDEREDNNNKSTNDKIFKTLKERDIHRRDCELIYGCFICKMKFKTLNELASHSKTHVFNNDKICKCKMCSKTFGKKSELQRHKIQHKSTKPFECKMCRKRLSNRGCLKQHMINEHSCKT